MNRVKGIALEDDRYKEKMLERDTSFIIRIILFVC